MEVLQIEETQPPTQQNTPAHQEPNIAISPRTNLQGILVSACLRQLSLKGSVLNLSGLLLVVAFIIIIKWLTSDHNWKTE